MNFTIVMPFYMNQMMLKTHYDGWASWGEKRRQRLRVIIVDDGSPEAAIDVPRPDGLEIAIYRVLEDRPWHQHGARNLGAYKAQEGWLLLTDMDHVLSEDSARSIFKFMDWNRLDDSAVYMLDRIDADTGLPTLSDAGTPKPHPNSFLVTRETFWRIGGYDEEFRGYGTDGLFKERAFKVASKRHLSIPLTRYSREVVHDASTRTLGRKNSEHTCDKDAVRAKKFAEGRLAEVLVMDFPWERVL